MKVATNSENFTDSEIINKILQGELKLYEQLIRKNNPYLYRIGRSYNYNHQDTEDLMQETYINAYYGLSKFEGKSSFKTWLTKIMLNKCFHKKQKASFKNETITERLIIEKSAQMAQNYLNTERSLLNKELGHVLETALNKIPEDYRLIFTLRELNGLNIKETAEATNLSESNVKVRLTRAKSMLRSEVEKTYSTAEIYEFNLIYCDKMVERVMAELML